MINIEMVILWFIDIKIIHMVKGIVKSTLQYDNLEAYCSQEIFTDHVAVIFTSHIALVSTGHIVVNPNDYVAVNFTGHIAVIFTSLSCNFHVTQQ